MKFKIRFKNPYFWIGLIGVIITAMGAKPEMFTSWEILMEQLKLLIGNPFLIGTVIVSVIGVFHDPTTKGLGDGKNEYADSLQRYNGTKSKGTNRM